MDKEINGSCLLFFHDWSPWKVVKEHNMQLSGWPIKILEQSKKCKRCAYVKIDVQTKKSRHE